MIVDEHVYDIVVAGGGTAGWMAALSAAREGKRVALLERKGYLGGVLASGLSILGFHDVNHKQVVKGYAHEFVERLKTIGGSAGYQMLELWHASMVSVDPALVKPTIIEMLHEAGVEIVLFSQVVDVLKEGKRIEGIVVQRKMGQAVYRGRAFIDASGDAVLSFLGDFPTEQSDELQPPTLVLRIENVDLDELREHLVAHPDAYVNWRMLPGHSVTAEFLKSSVKFLVYPDRIEQVETRGDYRPLIDRFMFTFTPNSRGVSVNMLRAHHVDGTSSESLSRATVDLYRNIVPLLDGFRRNIPGFSHSYLVDCEPEVQLRETRRIVGEYTLTVEDVLEREIFHDSVALGGYYIDIHSSKDSGGLWKLIEGCYGIPYRVLLSKDSENLITAGRCVSGSKEAAGSYRVMATSMAMGQAAGVAATLTVDEGCCAKDIDVERLRARLIECDAILE